jgi:4-diphosphocytidyl-2-C-methyl-D-erythritol kinase
MDPLPAGESVVRARAPAKINLYLHVVGRRADGYHLLDSLIAFADIGDNLSLTPADDLRIAIDGPFAQDVPATADNLVLRAARVLANAAPHKMPAAGVAIRLTKVLPVAAGLGGGSADAAATLRALARLWKIDLPDNQMAEIALGLGADVPACLGGVPVFVGGIGERLEPAPPLPTAPLVLVNPGNPLPTSSVFRLFGQAGRFSAAARWSDAPADTKALARMLADRRNDLTDAARSLAPEIDTVLALLQSRPGCLLARLSGSGATCFGLFESPESAAAAARTIRAHDAGWWVTATHLATTT